jgi:hypothetical protein
MRSSRDTRGEPVGVYLVDIGAGPVLALGGLSEENRSPL